MKKAINFYSEGVRLVGDVFYPDGLKPSDKRAGIVLCHGYTGVKDLYLPDNARVLNEAGYVVLTFDYKGWGDSEGPRSRLAPYSRVADVQAALTFLGMQPNVDPKSLGLYGTSYGGATVVWVGAVAVPSTFRKRLFKLQPVETVEASVKDPLAATALSKPELELRVAPAPNPPDRLKPNPLIF